MKVSKLLANFIIAKWIDSEENLQIASKNSLQICFKEDSSNRDDFSSVSI